MYQRINYPLSSLFHIFLLSSKVDEMHEMYDDRNETAVTPTDASLTKDEPQGIAPSVKTEEKEEVYITGIKLYLVLLGITLVGFLVMLDQTIMITAIPQISVRFNSLKDIGEWFFSSFDFKLNPPLPTLERFSV